ncbi:hypothetical protein CEXT_556251 [Caerostris extrusa]|uniref:Uncharacterized protein n=1 Tax=Caerostris extrusa TaxID=172846 RepID=A0AAV4WYV3_CAEEX|nr:hypothetical protein CEXT_556251 [Caerostris extrusa]
MVFVVCLAELLTWLFVMLLNRDIKTLGPESSLKNMKEIENPKKRNDFESFGFENRTFFEAAAQRNMRINTQISYSDFQNTFDTYLSKQQTGILAKSDIRIPNFMASHSTRE